MPARPLIIFPDARLRVPAEPIEAWDASLQALAVDVLDTLQAVSAIGLTASHIGRPLRLFVIRLQPDLAPVTYVNPAVLWASPERASHVEGSVAMPGVSESVERAARVTVRYRDLEGGEHQEEAEGFAAACLQHEIDQLDGIFWLDRLSRLRRERALKRYAKQRPAR